MVRARTTDRSPGAVEVRLRIEGHHLPGRRCGSYDDVHVALQVGKDPVDPVSADADGAVWETVLSVADPSGDSSGGSSEGSPDVRGPAVHGRRGERFAYLTRGSTGHDGFATFRRAKLPLDEVATMVAREGSPPEQVTARVDLTDDDAMPRRARLRPPAVTWSRS